MTRDRRRRRGFELSGSFPASQLALPARRSRELELQRAWRRVVGEAMAERLRLLSLRRGVLEIDIDLPDTERSAAVIEMLPGLIGRLRAILPRTPIRRCRARNARSGNGFSDLPVPAADSPQAWETDEKARVSLSREETISRGGVGGAGGGISAGRLERLMERYLERSGQKP